MQENRRIEEQSRQGANARSGVPARGRDGGMEKIRRQGPQKSFSGSEEPEKFFLLSRALTLDPGLFPCGGDQPKLAEPISAGRQFLLWVRVQGKKPAPQRIGVLRGGIRCAASLVLLVGGGGQHLIGPKLVSNLLWTSSLHTHPENTLYYLGSLQVNQPASRILRVLHVAIGDIDRQRYPPVPPSLSERPGFCGWYPWHKIR